MEMAEYRRCACFVSLTVDRRCWTVVAFLFDVSFLRPQQRIEKMCIYQEG